jgi:hypothetical protein
MDTDEKQWEDFHPAIDPILGGLFCFSLSLGWSVSVDMIAMV